MEGADNPKQPRTITLEAAEAMVASSIDSSELIGSSQNTFHIYLDYGLSLTAYMFGAAMHLVGQSTPLASGSMFASGMCFSMNAQYRGTVGMKRDVFFYEALGSWLWLLTSFPLFQVHKKMRFAGYSSWSGLLASSYFSVRYLADLMMN